MLCPECGTENADQAEFCVNCNHDLRLEEQPVSQENADDAPVTSTTNDQPVKAENNQVAAPGRRPRITDIDLQPDDAGDKPVVSTRFNIAIIVGTLVLPIIGVIVGFTYLRKEHPDAKKAGKVWLMLGAFMIIVNILLVSSMN